MVRATIVTMAYADRRSFTTVLAMLACTSYAGPIAEIDAPDDDAPPAARQPVAAVAHDRPPCVDPPPDARAPDEPMTPTTPGKPVRFGDVTCRGDREVWRDASDRIRVCTIATPVTLFGVPLAGDNYTHFHADGRPYQTTLAKPQTIATGNGTKVDCKAEHLVLDDKGVLESCTLARSTDFDRARCRGGESVGFAPSGVLVGCVADKGAHGLDIVFPAGTRVSWHESGAFESAWIGEPLEVAGWRVRYDVRAYATGKLAHFELAEPRTIAGIAVPERGKVWLREDGSPWQIQYVADEGFMVHGEPWSDTRTVRFDCAGQIVSDATDHYQAQDSPASFRERMKK
ncbi:MAG TPA: hypothetical protein VG755_37705 [Nannocystaceae bacterium]|nr:hypothetical protein [Nannocystaceae bacterium]